MSDEIEPYEKYDLALRVWERIGYVSDRKGSPFVYYHSGLNEYRLDRYLVTEDQLTMMTTGGWSLYEHNAKVVGNTGYHRLGEIIGCKTETVLNGGISGFYSPDRMPGYWIVSNLGKIDIFPGSNTRKPITVEPE